MDRESPTPQGRIEGDLTLTGGGDPSMSFETVPYVHDADPADPLAGIELLADGVVAAGVHRIAGNIVGDDSAYRSDPFPPGWAIDDTLFDYGAPVSALPLASNFIEVELTPAAEGDLALLNVTPASATTSSIIASYRPIGRRQNLGAKVRRSPIGTRRRDPARAQAREAATSRWTIRPCSRPRRCTTRSRAAASRWTATR